MNTKLSILQTAIDLFNESGTAAVSTNHIAAAAGISPGNLYYHYRNKEEIIRAIIEQMIARWSELWGNALQVLSGNDVIQNLLRRNFTIIWDFRFFFRELVPLLTNDPLLKQRYQKAKLQRMQELEGIIQQYAAAGVMKLPENKDDFRMLIKIGMLLNSQWLVDSEIDEDVPIQKQIEHGVAIFMYLLKPYLSSGKPRRKS